MVGKMKTMLAMYQGFLWPMRVLTLSEKYAMKGVARPSTTWPARMAVAAESTNSIFFRK